ncbi:MAG: ParM/StbA family protein [Anaerolineales bacterium]
MLYVGVDAGNGAFKIYGEPGGLETLSQVASDSGQRMANTLGMRKQKPPLRIQNGHGSFYIGAGAHDYGRPVENLDVERYNGAPEMTALFHGALTHYILKYGEIDQPLSIVLGLPQEAFTGENGDKENLRWMRGQHQWSANDKDYSLEIVDVRIAPQANGGLFDYLLDEQGKSIPEHKKAFASEVGIISIGFGTIELLVVRNRVPVQRFTTGATAGVRRLLEMINTQQLYSLGEMDIMLRAGQLDISTALPIWEREVMGIVERQWGNSWRRFEAVLLMGGGTILLKNSLPQRFNGKAFAPDNPVQAISRGLYKMSLLKKE